MLFEPFAVDAVVGADAFHKRPESLRVVHVRQMAEFMDDHIVEDGGRCQHQPPVEGKRTFCAAASPAGLLVTDGDAAEGSARERGKISGAFRKVFLCCGDVTLFEGGSLGVCQIGNGTAFTLFYGFQIVRDDPTLLI